MGLASDDPPRKHPRRDRQPCRAASGMARPVLLHMSNLPPGQPRPLRSEEHTSELQSRLHLVCRLLLEKKKKKKIHVSNECSVTRDDSELLRSAIAYSSVRIY